MTRGMKLRVDNFALIKHAEIDIDGITVIAGNNNTGKSTVGKILYSMFNALNNLDDKIRKQREEQLTEAVRYSFFEIAKEKRLFNRYSIVSYIVQSVLNDIAVGEIGWESIFTSIGEKFDLELSAEIKDKLQKEVEVVCTWPRDRLLKDSLRASFHGVFNGQINSLYQTEGEAKIDLLIKDTLTSIAFQKNDIVHYSSDISLIHKAIYYSSPLVIDFIDAWKFPDVLMRNLCRLLINYGDDITDEQNLFAQSMQLGRLESVISKIRTVIPGQLIRSSRDYALQLPNCSEPINLKNLSTGIKAFMVLKMLIEANIISRRDVVVLDEPEIHLHPTWQLLYAELIVLLQKEFALSVVITTHSNFFLNAIETYSRKYATVDKLKLYLADVQADGAVMKDVTNNPELIYQKMAVAVDVLTSERLNYE